MRERDGRRHCGSRCPELVIERGCLCSPYTADELRQTWETQENISREGGGGGVGARTCFRPTNIVRIETSQLSSHAVST